MIGFIIADIILGLGLIALLITIGVLYKKEMLNKQNVLPKKKKK